MTADWVQGDGSVADRLWLADWRRRVADLYAEVRAMAAIDPALALAHWRAVRERLYREHPQSPVPAADRDAFRASHFEHDPRLRFTVAIEPEAALAGAPDGLGLPLPRAPGAPAAGPPALAPALSLALPNSGAETLAFSRLGQIELPLPDGSRRLSVFWMAGYAGGLFIPFRDATNGAETYGAGRYLVDAAKGADLGGDPVAGTITIDFNFAFQPSCAFDPRWACPLASPENRLDVPIRAGERLA